MTIPLRSLHVKGYQSLHDVEVEFEPFTVLVGPSSSGKSAIVRSIDLLLQNKRGNGFIEHGQKSTEVRAELNDHVVTIRRGTSAKADANAYFVDDQDPFTKLGGTIPDPVVEVLRLPPDLTIAGQFDAPHMLTLAAPEVTRTLGALTNVDTVLRAAGAARKEKLQASSTAKTHRATLTDLQARVAEMDGLEEQDRLLTVAEEAFAEVERTSLVCQGLDYRVDQLQERQDRLDSLPEAKPLDELQDALLDADRIYGELERLDMTIAAVQRRHDRLAELPEPRSLDDVNAALFDALEAKDDFDAVFAAIERVANAQTKLKQVEERLETSVSVAQRASAAFEEALHEAGTCPLCGHTTAG